MIYIILQQWDVRRSTDLQQEVETLETLEIEWLNMDWLNWTKIYIIFQQWDVRQSTDL